ncbi:hypothetical protein GYMLUDRAFT_33585 [Collybiopsis luxurians FD-317 M1]|nr:hypothetical protein GYMLUDRAFT_33585 [Collybiopsis luxurians FD-317 M1]
MDHTNIEMLIHHYIALLLAFAMSVSTAMPVPEEDALAARAPLVEEKRQKGTPPGWKRQKGPPPGWKRQKGAPPSWKRD